MLIIIDYWGRIDFWKYLRIFSKEICRKSQTIDISALPTPPYTPPSRLWRHCQALSTAAVVLRLNKMAVCWGAESWERNGHEKRIRRSPTRREEETEHRDAHIHPEVRGFSCFRPQKRTPALLLPSSCPALSLLATAASPSPSPAAPTHPRLNAAQISSPADAGEEAGPAPKPRIRNVIAVCRR